MTRINPDSNDILVWPLTETSGPYRSVGVTSPNSATTDLIVPSSSSYVITTSNGASIDPGVTDIGNHSDEAMTTVALPFPFTIYGSTFNSASVSSNGFVEFGSSFQNYNVNIPQSSFGITIFAFERDEDTSGTGFGIFTSTVGTVGSRVFNIEFRNRQFGNFTTLNYEVRLFENSTTFEVIYGTSTSTATGAVGIQNSAGTIFTVYGNGIVIPAAGTKLTFTPAVTELVALRTSNGIFGNCPTFPGTSNFPTGSSSIRTYASGANTINPSGAFTISAWVKLKAYTTANNCVLIGKEYRNSSTFPGWSNPFYACQIQVQTSNGGTDWVGAISPNSASAQIGFTVTDFPIPLHSWSHIGMTWDGSAMRLYLNGVQCIYYSGATQLNSVAVPTVSFTDGTNGFGAWKIGAITHTGSGNKEEPNALIQDFRVANIVRSLSYFQNIYRNGLQPGFTTTATQYYKLRAYDMSCSTPTAVTWIDTQVSLVNAPALPCSGPFTNLEVLDTWLV